MQKNEVQLSERDIKRKKAELAQAELDKINIESNLKRMKAYADTGLYKRQTEQGVKMLEDAIKNKKDAEGNELDGLGIEDYKIQLECRKEELEKNKPTKEISVAVQQKELELENKKQNIDVLKKQLREGKIYVQQ